MKISYDKDADALYIRFLEGEFQCRVVQLTQDIALDFATGERLVGMELLGASRLIKNGGAPEIELKDIKARAVSS
jgi:uncharacterized protein YuzE